ncbi:MAG: hypothetical protein P8X78_00845 [Nitrosopumilaceae archaeon]
MADFSLAEKLFTDNFTSSFMDSCVSGSTDEVCWFCRKGRHDDCMKEIPIDGKSDGPHDCTFDTKMIPCKCKHQTK